MCDLCHSSVKHNALVGGNGYTGFSVIFLTFENHWALWFRQRDRTMTLVKGLLLPVPVTYSDDQRGH